MQGQFWNITAGKSEAEIDIFGLIGDYGFMQESVAAADFVQELRSIGLVSTLNVNLHSEGGSVWDGLAIYNAIREFKVTPGGERVVRVGALAASIASVVMLAGDRIEVAPEAQVMIHNPMGATIGGQSDHELTAKRLGMAKDQILQIYQRRTGSDREHLSDLMDAETWFAGDEIRSAGFADVVTEDTPVVRVAAGPLRLVNQYRNTPPELLKRKPTPLSPEIAARVAKLAIDTGSRD